MDQQNLKDQPVGDLVKQLSEQTATLVRKEMQLGQLEMQEKAKRGGLGAGLFGGAGLIAVFGVGALVAAAVAALATTLALWLSALIVGAVLLAIAGIAALMGKKQVEQAVPPAPEQAVESGKRTIDEVKGRAGR
ncbi:MAG: phage holin family protein [Thermoleophilaceae bacterium]|nr:phage holin family protein [Thermoleophilaceae bacterium]